MFKKNFIKLCNKNGVSPSAVCRAVGITPATFSCWTDESVPRRATLQKIADYFGVTVDYLLGNDTPAPAALSPHEQQLIEAYRRNAAMRSAVDKLLGIEPQGAPISEDIADTLAARKKIPSPTGQK